jgi:hypothetical protein
MIAFIHEVENIAEQYGLQITGLDATDVTLMVRMEVMPSVFIHVYRNLKKNKLNMALYWETTGYMAQTAKAAYRTSNPLNIHCLIFRRIKCRNFRNLY